MLRLKALGWGARGSRGAGLHPDDGAAVADGGRVAEAAAAARPKGLDGLETWLAERFRRHARQRRRGAPGACGREGHRGEPAHGGAGGARLCVRRWRPRRGRRCASRRRRASSCRSTSASGGSRSAARHDQGVLFVATLGYSRRLHVRAFRGERQEHWFEGLESAFTAFGGVPEEVLLDNAARAGRAPRRGDARGRVQRQAPRVRPALGLPAAGLRAVPGAHEGQGRARRRLREEERDRRALLRELGGARGASRRAGRARSPTVRVHGTTGEAPTAALRSATRRARLQAARRIGRRSGRCAS